MIPSRKIYFFQPQYTNIFNGKKQCWLPYSAGCVWAYALGVDSIKENFRLGGFFFKRDPLDKVLEQINDPDVCCFSVYVWNENYSLALAEKIKKRWPKCLIVMGGPQATGNWTKFNFIDTIVLGEGERSLVSVLEKRLKGTNPELFVKTERMDSLSNVPSPYYLGLFDDIVKNNPDLYWSAPLETNRGCPYGCTFCDWGGGTLTKIKKFDLHRVKQDLDWIISHRVKTIFLADGNFGIFKDRDFEIAQMIRDAAEDSDSDLEYVSATYAKNSTEHIFQIAKAFGPLHKGITFSVQSMNNDTLDAIRRKNMEINQIRRLLELSKEYKVHHYTELILGLPLETKETWKNSICQIMELGQHHRLEIHPCNVLEHTEMYDNQRSKYALGLVNAVNIVPFSEGDPSGIVEYFPTVSSTSTMSRSDMIESWLYAWAVVHFHFSGYTQLLSQYCYHVLKISYREFYDRLFKILQADAGILGNEFLETKKMITNFFVKGFTERPDVYDMLWHSSSFFFENIEKTINLGLAAGTSLGDIDPGILEIQRRFLENQIWTVPYETSAAVDIDSWENRSSSYLITSSNNNLEINATNLYTAQRRNKKLFNIINKISK